MAVAIGSHAGGHLDNSAQIASEDGHLQLLTRLVLFLVALLAARSLWAASKPQQIAPVQARVRKNAPEQ